LFSFVGDQTQTSSWPNLESRNLWCLLVKSCWNINITTMLWMLFSLFVWKIYFFGFIKALDSKGNNKCAKSCWNINKSHLRYWLSREKNLKPSVRQKLYFFSRNFARNIYIFIFVWIIDEMTFSGYFSFGVNKNLRLQNHAEPTVAKKSLQNPDFKATYHLSVNSYHTLAGGKSIP